MGNRFKKSDFTIVIDSSALTLMKLRKSRATKLSKVSKGVFICILEYYEPTRKVSNHYKYNPDYPINYTWPEKVSYHNPVIGFKTGFMFFKLRSGETTDFAFEEEIKAAEDRRKEIKAAEENSHRLLY